MTRRPSLSELESAAPFAGRHIGPSPDEQAKMLAVLGAGSLEELAASAVPEAIRATERLDLPAGLSEAAVLAELRALAAQNTVTVPMLGLGYSGTHTPAVVLRNVMENPAWYTAYTPYQPEISQGRLEALLNFQTVITDLTGLDIAGASLLDEATAAAEAMTLTRRSSKAPAGAAFVVDADCHPQTIAVVQTRAVPLGIEVRVEDLSAGLPEGELFGVLLQYPGSGGAVRDRVPS
jgi:glycine dehydrogenase